MHGDIQNRNVSLEKFGDQNLTGNEKFVLRYCWQTYSCSQRKVHEIVPCSAFVFQVANHEVPRVYNSKSVQLSYGSIPAIWIG